MSGVISRHSHLNEVFDKYINVGEVYASMDFSLEDTTAAFYIFSNTLLDTARIFHKVQQGYNNLIKVYTTKDPLDPMFINKRIIWKNGVWYL